MSVNPSPSPTLTTSADDLHKVAAFLNRIGIVATFVDEPLHGFLDGVKIHQGQIQIGTNAQVEDVLHEAGHLATTPKPFRHWMNDNLAKGQKKALDAMTRLNVNPESDLGRHVLQFTDTEATAWAYAAGKELGFDDAKIISDQSYDGDGASIRAMCRMGKYFGVSGLVAAGMCDSGLAAKMRGNPAYPAMLRWTQDGPYPEWKDMPEPGDRQAAPSRRMGR